MRFSNVRAAILFMLILLPTIPVHAQTQWQVDQTLKLDSEPVDMVVSQPQRQVYILTSRGEILIYGFNGVLKGRIQVGQAVHQIKAAPGPDRLFLLDSQAHTLQLISISLVQSIDIEGAPFEGPAAAPVTLVVFSDFQCPYCSRLVPVLKQVREHFPDKVKIVFKNFPLRSHQYALAAAQAAIAAGDQGKFWKFHDLLFDFHDRLNDQKIKEIATVLKLDQKRFEKDMQAPETMARIDADVRDGRAAGVRGTPTVFVNGIMVRDKTIQGLKRAVREALAKKEAS